MLLGEVGETYHRIRDNCIESMPNRLQILLNNLGNKIAY